MQTRQIWVAIILFAVGPILVVAESSADVDSLGNLLGAHYVNMGSSFAAGTGVAPIIPSSGRCRQSERSYARLLADSLSLNLDDQSCAGAKTEHLLGPWGDMPRQLEALTDATRLVTITIGGNDLFYVRNLFAASCNESEGLLVQGQRRSCPKWTDSGESAYEQLEAHLSMILKEVSTKAPNAVVFLIQYLSMLDEELCETTPISEVHAQYFGELSHRLSSITTRAAEAHRVTVIAADELSASHTSCDAEPWSIGAFPTASNAEGMPWHPNSRGNEVIAELLERKLVAGASQLQKR